MKTAPEDRAAIRECAADVARSLDDSDGHTIDVEAAAQLAAVVPRLLDDLDGLDSWAGLMSLLDEHYPADVFGGPAEAGQADTDPGVLIVRLIRVVDSLRPIVEKAQHIRDVLPRSGTAPGAAELQSCLYELANMIDVRRRR